VESRAKGRRAWAIAACLSATICGVLSGLLSGSAIVGLIDGGVILGLALTSLLFLGRAPEPVARAFEERSLPELALFLSAAGAIMTAAILGISWHVAGTEPAFAARFALVIAGFGLFFLSRQIRSRAAS
jgi:hypothetical protein